MTETGIYSKECKEIEEEISVARPEELRSCKACGKPFLPKGRNKSRQSYCTRPHFRRCATCGEEFTVKDIHSSCATCSDECSKKYKQKQTAKSIQEKYGVDNISQSAEFKDKISASIKAKASIIKQKSRKTMHQNYGVDYPLQSAEIKARAQRTMQEKYGCSNPMELQEFRDKVSAHHKSEEHRLNYTATSMHHYGVPFPAMAEEVQYAMRKTAFEHYGTEYPSSLQEVKDKTRATCMEKYGAPCAFLTEEAQLKARESLLSNGKKGRVSALNRAIGDKLIDTVDSVEYEFYLAKKWYDIKLTNSNILIEINPSYTHTCAQGVNHYCPEGLDKNYHRMKTMIATDHNYRCIHIFDWDDIDKLVSLLKPKEPIYARKCKVVAISNTVASAFLDKYHLQGKCSGVKFACGLFYNDELVEVMTFGTPRYNKKYEWELLRLASADNYSVIGGASKLFNLFVATNCPKSVLSYCDISKFTGHVYLQLGFTLHHLSEPTKVWSKGNRYITDNLLRQRGFDQLFNTNHGKGTSNEELMLKDDWLPVYDCGQAAYEWYS